MAVFQCVRCRHPLKFSPLSAALKVQHPVVTGLFGAAIGCLGSGSALLYYASAIGGECDKTEKQNRPVGAVLGDKFNAVVW